MALKSVIEAYSRLYVEEEARKKAHRLQVLNEQAVSLSNEDASYKGQIDAITSRWATSDLTSLAAAKRASMDRLWDLLQEINMRLALAPSSTTRPT